MDILRDNEAKVMCPYNAAHYIRKGRMDVHLKKCRNAYKESQVMVICDFNASHRIPEPELQYHHDTCPYRKTVELHVFSEESAAPPTFASVPAVPVPVDSSWDDEDIPTYNPQKYCEENQILRRIDTEPAAVRRDFRIAERHRFSNLGALKNTPVGNNQQPGPASKSDRRSENVVSLPPIPAFSQRNDDVPADVREMMAKLSIIPKKAVIPKSKK